MTNTFDLHFTHFKSNFLGIFGLAGLVILLSLGDTLMLKNNMTIGTSTVAASTFCKLDSPYNNFGDSESYLNAANRGKMDTQDLSLLATNWRSSW